VHPIPRNGATQRTALVETHTDPALPTPRFVKKIEFANPTGSLQIVGPILAGLLLLAAFVAWELRTQAPMLPMRFFRNRTFTLANAVSLFMSFGMFGAIFLLAQYFQTVQGYSPLQSGLRFLPWSAMPMIVAPIAGALSDKIGGYKLLGVGLTLQAAGLA
jgi:nitrate/nitrite transporter NarK